jgi:hypothetical protein
MRYSVYKYELEAGNEFRIYLKMQDGSVVCYKFLTLDHMFSNMPNATRWFGQIVLGEDDYYLYPVSTTGIAVGEFEILQIHEKFIRVKFINGLLEGEWYFRNITGGEVLFWKPKPEGFVCGMNNVSIEEKIENIAVTDKVVLEQAFGSSLVIEGRDFSGPCMSAGIVTGLDRVSTLFTNEFLEKFTKKLQNKIDELIVDVDHEFLATGDKEGSNTGGISEIKLKENKKLNYIWCKGQTTHPLPVNAGMSVTLKTDAVWDDELNIYVAVDGDPIGVSITDKIQPACKICWVE